MIGADRGRRVRGVLSQATTRQDEMVGVNVVQCPVPPNEAILIPSGAGGRGHHRPSLCRYPTRHQTKLSGRMSLKAAGLAIRNR